MSEKFISIIEIARLHKRRKQSVFKILKRLGIEQIKAPREGSRGQKVSYIRRDDYEIVQLELDQLDSESSDNNETSISGVFYVIQLEPDHDPGRIKVGFATNIAERLRSHRTVAPLCQLVKTWPCKSLWEKTVIDSVCHGYERLYTEVFRVPSLADVEARCERFFSVMPELASEHSKNPDSPIVVERQL